MKICTKISVKIIIKQFKENRLALYFERAAVNVVTTYLYYCITLIFYIFHLVLWIHYSEYINTFDGNKTDQFYLF